MEAPTSVDDRIIAHLGYARAVAGRALDPRCRGADREDLIAWGLLGLVQAAYRFREDTGAPFGAYAARRVRGQVLDALRQRDPLTRAARREYRVARALDDRLPPPVVEVSLEQCGAAATEQRAEPRCRTARDRRWLTIADALRDLPAVERRVLILSFARCLTLREIGAEIGLSESGACRVRSRALRRLRRCCAA